MPSPLTSTCWVLHDGVAGNRRQTLALATALGLPCREWVLRARGPARWFAPRQFPGAGAVFGQEFADALRGPRPSLAIGCGRIAALATRQARLAGISSVQILDPRLPTRHWDLVIAPEHDGLRGDNVITLLGSLNPVDDAWLRCARLDFPAMGQLSGPRTAVLLGGPTGATRFDAVALQELCKKLECWLARDGGSLVICGSRRTPPAWASALRTRFRPPAHLVWMNEDDGRNPFAAALAWADRIVVSPDSVNMISEACATAVPVYIAAPERAAGRIGTFIRALQARDRVRALEHEPTLMNATPLEETAQVAMQVRERLRLR